MTSLAGRWNARMAATEKGFYAIGFVPALVAAQAVQKNMRDLAPFKAGTTATADG